MLVTAPRGDCSVCPCHLQGPQSKPQVRELEGRFLKRGQKGPQEVRGSCSGQWVACTLPVMTQRYDGTSDNVTGDRGTRGLGSMTLIDDPMPSTRPPHLPGCPLTLCPRAMGLAPSQHSLPGTPPPWRYHSPTRLLPAAAHRSLVSGGSCSEH